jgi:pantetheine-phosphate adenylyltransferase
MRTVVYPGSFDPITNGHLDVVQRAAKMFDRVILAVARNEGKHPLFSLEERKRLALSAVSGLGNVVVETFEGLLVDYVVRHGACAVVRGLRAVSDFEFEFQLALMNRKLEPNLETLFLMPREELTYISSRLVKEISRLGGNVNQFVPPHVVVALKQKQGRA